MQQAGTEVLMLGDPCAGEDGGMHVPGNNFAPEQLAE
jgi:hypothetical protein